MPHSSPEGLEDFLSGPPLDTESPRPILYDLSQESERTDLSARIAEGAIRRVVDPFESEQRELFAIRDPERAFSAEFERAFAEHRRASAKDVPAWQQGIWAYFPWRGDLVHLLKDADYQTVRMARNNPLLSPQEQRKFYEATIALAGLSVGNSAALAIVLAGGARRIRLADHDTLDLSNLNRIRAGVGALGVPKAVLTAEQIYELNPYAEIELFPSGITAENVAAFTDGADVIVDEMDSIAAKWRLREAARARRIPVVMAADLDESSIVDVERYDLDPGLAPFHGRLDAADPRALENLDKKETGRAIAQLVGLENHTPRMLAALQSLGKAVVSWPQLGPTALASGVYVSYCVERIVNGKPLMNGRTVISLDRLLNPDYAGAGEARAREEAIAAFTRLLAP